MGYMSRCVTVLAAPVHSGAADSRTGIFSRGSRVRGKGSVRSTPFQSVSAVWISTSP